MGRAVFEAAVEIKNLSSLSADQRIMVTVKVKKVEAPEKVNGHDREDLEKQDCVVGVGDSSGCGQVVLWEQDTGRLKEGEL